uniref:Uncharacterized protein n=1 Tax=Avena sativa TaxID=4498 RepID=A0ACD5Z6V8_AVESA
MFIAYFGGVITAVLQNEWHIEHLDFSSAPSKILTVVASHVGNHPCRCPSVDPRWSFSSQILSIPFLWHCLPDFKEVFSTNGFSSNYIHQKACFVTSSADILPNDILANHPGQACLLANVLETATWILSEPDFTPESGAEIVDVCTLLLDAFPKITSPVERTYVDGTIPIDVDVNNCLDFELQKHISTTVQHLVNAAASAILRIHCSDSAGPSITELQFVGSVSYFLYGMLHTTLIDGIMTELAYYTEIVPALWNFIKICHTNDKWQLFSKYCSPLLPDTPGWLLPLSIFCLMYSHILRFMDIVELRKSENPLSLDDLPPLVFILKEALWELLLTIPPQSSSLQTTPSSLDKKKMLIEILMRSVRDGLCELLIQLEDWNNMDQFVPPLDFCSKKDFSDEFAPQAIIVGTHESEIIRIIRLAPFLVPFDIRLEIFQLRLAADQLCLANSRQALECRTLEISRPNLWKDAFDKLNLLSAEDLKGRIQIVFFNEHGMKEAGVDGGGIFRDFMSIIIQHGFSMDTGLFKETADHLLYPNPESKAHEDHLQYFHFLGVLLGKAIYEGIPVGLVFAIFFLRKLKQKATFFNDLFSLDPEMYHGLLNLKNSDDLSHLHFTTVDGKELFPGGRKMHVTTHNVITYLHLVANYQLNCQNCEQTAQFLKGFQQLIPTEWTDMFNEHEFQIHKKGARGPLDGSDSPKRDRSQHPRLFISGPLSLNVEDLRLNTNYGGEYDMDHEVIIIFWKVLMSFRQNEQEQFLMYVTGCTRGPIRGFKTLDPKFGIISYGDDPNHLPRASTCSNQLHLPPYKTVEQMRGKLIQAMSSKSGFDLI